MSDKEEKQKITCNIYYGQYAEFLTIHTQKNEKPTTLQKTWAVQRKRM